MLGEHAHVWRMPVTHRRPMGSATKIRHTLKRLVLRQI